MGKILYTYTGKAAGTRKQKSKQREEKDRP